MQILACSMAPEAGDDALRSATQEAAAARAAESRLREDCSAAQAQWHQLRSEFDTYKLVTNTALTSKSDQVRAHRRDGLKFCDDCSLARMHIVSAKLQTSARAEREVGQQECADRNTDEAGGGTEDGVACGTVRGSTCGQGRPPSARGQPSKLAREVQFGDATRSAMDTITSGRPRAAGHGRHARQDAPLVGRSNICRSVHVPSHTEVHVNG